MIPGHMLTLLNANFDERHDASPRRREEDETGRSIVAMANPQAHSARR